MGKNAAAAVALVLLYVAFACFYIAFHPGGIRSPLFVSDSNPKGDARNPRDVIRWFMQRVSEGSPTEPVTLQ